MIYKFKNVLSCERKMKNKNTIQQSFMIKRAYDVGRTTRKAQHGFPLV